MSPIGTKRTTNEGMAVAPTRAEEFRRQAQECLDLARAISLETDRAILIEIAQTDLLTACGTRSAKGNYPAATTGTAQ